MPLDAATEERRAYLLRVLRELCDDIGVRDAGSEGDARAADLLERELIRSCDSFERQRFSFERWTLSSPAHLSINGHEAECYPYYGSAAPPAKGLQGRSRIPISEDGALTVTSGAAGAIANLMPGPFGPAVPRFDPAVTAGGLPTVGIGDEERERIRLSQGTDGARVSLSYRTERVREAWTENLAGTIAGETTEEILLIAHRDTQYNTPGANDNGATLAAMLLVAGHFKRRRPFYTLRFLASAAEEIGCLGAEEYAAARAADGTLGRIRLCLNFDSLTYGPNPHISSKEERPASLLAESYRDSSLISTPVRLDETDSLDGAPFASRGVPTVYVNTRGDDAKLRLWHRPEDRSDTVDPELVEHSCSSLVRFLERLGEEGP